jgi:hypothetical protein
VRWNEIAKRLPSRTRSPSIPIEDRFRIVTPGTIIDKNGIKIK